MPFRFEFDEESLRTIKNCRKLKAQPIGEALERLRREKNGRLKPGDFVEDAKIGGILHTLVLSGMTKFVVGYIESIKRVH